MSADASYPRPLLRRAQWTRLDGAWEFALDPHARARAPREVRFERKIEVPFAPETPRSGIDDRGMFRACWYRREIRAPELEPGQKLALHFGAVDYEAHVWIDGELAGKHEGGYTPFELHFAERAARGGLHELVVRATDDPDDLAKPRGKQTFRPEPFSIWYPRTTGIWQPVWLETLPRAHLAELRWTPDLTRWEIALDARVAAPRGERFFLAVRLSARGNALAEDRYEVIAGEVHRRIALSDPGIDDFRNELLWSPTSPTLLDAELALLDADGRTVDAATSYTALRSFNVDGGRFLLNGRPFELRMVLDQGYWPESGMTAPSTDALERDVVLTKLMGFNGARKHQKIEDPRYLYFADRLGLVVWEEMPSAYRFTRASIERVTREWIEALARDVSHPCIVAWVPFNESWGVPNLPESRPERHYVEALYHLTKTLDPTRLVVGNDGWESVVTDVVGVHDYDDDPARIAARYASIERAPQILMRERPGGRALVLGRHDDAPIVLSEMGGIALADGTDAWGYTRARGADELADRYARLVAAVRALPIFAGFCYTQLTDTYQEANGLLYADRTPKIPVARIAAATGGEGARAAVSPPTGERDGAPR